MKIPPTGSLLWLRAPPYRVPLPFKRLARARGTGRMMFAEPAGALALFSKRYRRDSLLEAVAIAAKELLRPSDLAVSLPKVDRAVSRKPPASTAAIFS